MNPEIEIPKTAGFCRNSRKWVDFFISLPDSCPQKGFQGNSYCQDEACGYYEERPVSEWYREKVKLIHEVFSKEAGS